MVCLFQHLISPILQNSTSSFKRSCSIGSPTSSSSTLKPSLENTSKAMRTANSMPESASSASFDLPGGRKAK